MYLGIDCSGVNASLVLLGAGGEIFSAAAETPRQADVIFPLLEKLLADANTHMQQIRAIGVVTGPGSFTGIRVGLSLAQGLADGLGIPAYGVDAFYAIRTEMGDGKREIIVLESKRSELYVQDANEIKMLLPEQILKMAKGRSIIHNLGESSPFPPLPSPLSHLAPAAARHAARLHAQNQPGEILAPFYVRDADAKPAA